jgi:TolB-like protein/DNA-binding winged helix-turn-helix (wHTH) protein/Flp pilus assembly protein TadD
MVTPGQPEIFCFGEFALDLTAYELRRKDRRVKLGRQPMDLLILLVERPGQLVSRQTIVDRLWGADVFVDVETGVNTAISKVRQALRDSADAPAFVETVPGKGYRFIAPVQRLPLPAAVEAALPTLQPPVVTGAPAPGVAMSTPDLFITARPPLRRSWAALVASGLLLIVMAVGLAVIRSVRNAPAQVALAVLPFENLGSDPEREYLAAGLTDETSASLAQVDYTQLRVKGRSADFKGSTKTVSQIGQELGVDYLLEGSVRTEGSQVRVTVTLIRVADQEHVWSQSYEREPRSLLGLQQELSTGIAEQIRLRLSPGRATGITLRQTQSAEAWDAFLRARYQAHRRTADGNARAIDLYKQAIALDPDYALAWSDLAVTFGGSTVNGDADPMVVRPLARDAAIRAVRANPELSEAQLARGYERWLLEWDWKGAEAGMRLAINLDPSNGQAFRLLGHILSQAGRQDEAEEAMRRARELDPTDPLTYGLSSQVAFQAGHFDRAIEHARRTILLEPQFWIGHIMLAAALDRTGEPELALEALSDAARFSNGNSKVLSLRGYVLAELGRTEAARDVLRDLEAKSREHYVPPYASALVLAGLGDREGMFAALERAFVATDIHLMYLPVDSRWDRYRSDPRFVDLVKRCRFDRGQ